MKKISSLIIMVSLALTACDKNTDTSSVNEGKVVPVVEDVAVVEKNEAMGDEGVLVKEEHINRDKPSISASHRATVSAVVEAISHETREVTLRRKDGKIVSFVVSEKARNLDQVEVGDILVVEYIENLDIQVMTVDDAKAEAGVAGAVARAKEGEMPGIAKVETMLITATVEEINLDENTFRLKGPQGNIQQYTVRNPANLQKAAVGDLVVITQTKAIALEVQKAAE